LRRPGPRKGCRRSRPAPTRLTSTGRRGFQGSHAPGHLLSFRGLYNAIYRVGSQPTHGSIASLLPYRDQESNRFVVRQPKSESTLPYALVSPLLAMTLTVVSSEVKWIDEPKVRAINDAACASGPIT
jgi:hypothetical protein